MCMKSYREIIAEIAGEIAAIDTTVVIIGDNATGKSDVIHKVTENLLGHVYFIDAVNRSFDLRKIKGTIPEQQQLAITKMDVKSRLQEDYFNLKDTFAQQDSIEQWYAVYEAELQKLMKDFWQQDLKVCSVQVADMGKFFMAYANGEQIQLSSGYQAVFRLAAECLVCRDYLQTDGEKIVIVIDEIDEFLSARSAGEILSFLRKTFPEFRFIVSTHSADLLVDSKDYILFALTGRGYLRYDGNDLDSITGVYSLFRHLFLKNHSFEEAKEQELTDTLSRYLNMKLMGAWSAEAEAEFHRMKYDEMTNTQKFLYQQIKEWHT